MPPTRDLFWLIKRRLLYLLILFKENKILFKEILVKAYYYYRSECSCKSQHIFCKTDSSYNFFSHYMLYLSPISLIHGKLIITFVVAIKWTLNGIFLYTSKRNLFQWNNVVNKKIYNMKFINIVYICGLIFQILLNFIFISI